MTNGVLGINMNMKRTRKPVGLWLSQKHGIHTDVSDDNLETTTTAIGMPQKIYMQGLSSDFEQFFLVIKTTLFICFRNKYGFQIGNAVEKINSFDQEEMLKMA